MIRGYVHRGYTECVRGSRKGELQICCKIKGYRSRISKLERSKEASFVIEFYMLTC
jgi:hypothetical protein